MPADGLRAGKAIAVGATARSVHILRPSALIRGDARPGDEHYGAPGFTVTATRVDGHPAVRVRGELDVATAPRLRSALRAALAEGEAHLIVDLAAVQFIAMAGLHVLEEAGRQLQQRAGRLILRRPSRAVVRLLSLRQAWTSCSPWHIQDPGAGP